MRGDGNRKKLEISAEGLPVSRAAARPACCRGHLLREGTVSERVQCQGTCGAPGLSHSPQQHRGVQVIHVVWRPHGGLSPPAAGRGTVLTPGRSAHRPLPGPHNPRVSWWPMWGTGLPLSTELWACFLF